MNETPGKLELVVDNTEPVLKVDGGGPKPPNPPKDWLSPMKSGTEFLVKDKTGMYAPKFVRVEYTHGGKLYGNVLLIPTKTMNKPETWNWVNPLDFCSIFELTDILEEPE